MLVSRIICCAAVALSADAAFAGNNGLDTRFGASGAAFLAPTPVSGLSIEDVYSIALQSDGKIIVAGRSRDNADNTWLAALGRLNADGTWDTTFADHGVFVLPFGIASAPFGAALNNARWTTDGAILVSGGTYDGTGSFRSCTLLMEFDASGGTLLPDFGGKGTGGNFCFDFAPNTTGPVIRHYEGLQFNPDDSFYLTTPSTNLPNGAVAHFDSSGIIDHNYGDNGSVDLPFFASILTLQSDGSLYAVGGNDAISVTRLDSTGAVDMLYGTGGVFTTDTQAPGGIVSVRSAVLDAQGRLLIADNDATSSTDYVPYRFARVTSGGNADATFNPSGQQPGAPGFATPIVSGTTINDYVVAAQTLSTGEILAAGSANDTSTGSDTTNVALVLMNSDASFDTRFGDSAHPGWASINIGVNGSNNVTTALAFDPGTGFSFVATTATDKDGHTCPVILRVLGDRLFADGFEAPLAPTCGQ